MGRSWRYNRVFASQLPSDSALCALKKTRKIKTPRRAIRYQDTFWRTPADAVFSCPEGAPR